MKKYDFCGLKIKEGDDIDLAAFESAVSLTGSSIIDTVEISPQSILVCDDYISQFRTKAVAVDFCDGQLTSSQREVKIQNNIWDGQSLLDSSVFSPKYSDKGLLLLRNQFFKTCSFNTDIAGWFRDNGITDVSQLNGFTLAKDISQIKMITTKSSIKYLKFGSLRQWLGRINSTFGVVKYDKPTGYFGGRMAQTHYQLLNTLGLSYSDMEELLRPALDYISRINSDPAVLRYHIKLSPSSAEPSVRSKNDMVFALLARSVAFSKTDVYHSFKKELVRSMVKKLRRGHILVNGTYATLFGNGPEMLLNSIGKFGGESIIGRGNVWSKRFAVGSRLLAVRSPHIVSGNIYLCRNTPLPRFSAYFNLTNEIVCVNSIGENLQQRLNGADFDSDAVLITDNPLLVSKAAENYDKFLVPTSLVRADKRSRKYSAKQQADLDSLTGVNKIGEIVNLSQELNSRLWHNISGGTTNKQTMALYYDVCKLAVLSGIEIDKAKKEYLVNSEKELAALKKKYRLQNSEGKTIKPLFFKMLTRENGYKIPGNIAYEYMSTPMDFLQKILAKFRYSCRDRAKTPLLPLYSVMRVRGENRGYGNYQAYVDDIAATLRRFSAMLRKAYSGSYSKEALKGEVAFIMHSRQTYIKNLRISKRAAYLILKAIDNPEFSDVKSLLLSILFVPKNKALFEIIRDIDDGVDVLKECKRGDVKLYDYSFRRAKIGK